MVGRVYPLAMLATAAFVLAGCGPTVAGSATWPGATLEKVILNVGDFPPGVQFDRIAEQPGQPDGAGGPPSMNSRPTGCANALTNVIARAAERGPGSAVKYAVTYDGARVVMTVVSWNLNLDNLQAEAERCARFEALFDTDSKGIPITTTKVPGFPDGVLAYQQTMQLGGASNSVYLAFGNVGRLAVFGSAFPTADPAVAVKASLPQTFLDIFAKQIDKMEAA